MNRYLLLVRATFFYKIGRFEISVVKISSFDCIYILYVVICLAVCNYTE